MKVIELIEQLQRFSIYQNVYICGNKIVIDGYARDNEIIVGSKTMLRKQDKDAVQDLERFKRRYKDER